MFKGYTVAEILRDAGAVERDFLDAIISNTVTIVFGAPGVGKTTVVAETIAAGLDGRNFAGRSWSKPLNRVAVITTDADGAIDYATMLDAAREQVGTDNDVIIWPIRVPPSQAGWQDLTNLVQVQKPDLVVLDNIGQATAGPLNEDQTATDLWIDLAGLRPNESGGPALLWVAHAPKRGEGGWRAETAIGSQYWTAYSRNRIHVHESPRSAGAEITMTCHPRTSALHDIHLSRSARGRLEVVGATTSEEIVQAKRDRNAVTRDRNAQVAEVILGECRNFTQADTARVLADRFPDLSARAKDRPRAIAQTLAKGQQFGAIVVHDGTEWAPRAA